MYIPQNLKGEQEENVAVAAAARKKVPVILVC